MIEISNINLSFKDKEIFNYFNFSISKNEKVGIKGESGRGKTTLLNLIMGFIHPDKGCITIEKEILNFDNLREIRQKIAYVPQNIILLGESSVKDSIYIPLNFALNKKFKPSEKEIIFELEKLNLDKEILNSEISKISGGEKQRIAIIIAKLLKRKILILDEPTSSLDELSKKLVVDYLFNDNVTIISVSHDNFWLENCNKILSL